MSPNCAPKRHILGIDNGHKLIIVGAGHLGHALLQNFDFKKVGFQIDTAFDVSPALVGTKIHDVAIRSMVSWRTMSAKITPTSPCSPCRRTLRSR